MTPRCWARPRRNGSIRLVICGTVTTLESGGMVEIKTNCHDMGKVPLAIRDYQQEFGLPDLPPLTVKPPLTREKGTPNV